MDTNAETSNTMDTIAETSANIDTNTKKGKKIRKCKTNNLSLDTIESIIYDYHYGAKLREICKKNHLSTTIQKLMDDNNKLIKHNEELIKQLKEL